MEKSTTALPQIHPGFWNINLLRELFFSASALFYAPWINRQGERCYAAIAE